MPGGCLPLAHLGIDIFFSVTTLRHAAEYGNMFDELRSQVHHKESESAGGESLCSPIWSLASELHSDANDGEAKMDQYMC